MTSLDNSTPRELAGPSGPLLHLRVFLASPGDVAEERALAFEALDRLSYDPLLVEKVTIRAVAWDKPGAGMPMFAEMTPQEAIKAGLPRPSQCDIVVVILWSRMGTLLPVAEYRKPDGSAYLSGTEWEYLDALEATQRHGRPEILVYRRTQPCLLNPADPQFKDKLGQWEAVSAFFAAFRNPDGSISHGANDYATPEDFRQQLNLHLRSIIRRLQDTRSAAQAARIERAALAAPAARAEPVAGPPLWTGSPFPGLRAFTPDDAPIFFGRGRETDELVRRLSDASTRFLMVVGASGSGKSSLVAAGLLPRLGANAIEGAKDWLVPRMAAGEADARKHWAGLRFTPGELGDNPFQALAVKLTPLLPEHATTPRRVAERLEGDPARLVQLIDAALAGRPSWAEALLFIDQFEELFTVVAERHQAPFVDMLAAAAAQTLRLRTVATLRADFYHRCVERPELAEILRPGSYPLAAPGLAALLEMVTGPAARAGLDFEDGLPDRILDDTGNDPGALALLAFALHDLYQTRTPEGRLTHRAYDAFGGVRRAISRRADETFADLPGPVRSRLADVFRDLVEVDERGVATRRRVPLAPVVSSVEPGRLVDAFVEARLLVTDRGPAGEAMVEVAHEALLREWPRLAEWISERADDLRLLRQAQAAAAEWERSGRDASHLWPHERLAPVHDMLSRLGMDRATLDEPARSFLRPEAERLLEELERPETSHYRRAEIGDRLDRIGDPRPGVGVGPDGLPDIVWCEIAGGPVTLEGVEGRFVVNPFLIAKYPVTYRQYKAFLDDPRGYQNEGWWEGLKREPEPGEQYRQVGNCPAENVPWSDAITYCRWLSARLGDEVRLPTEPEWQQAATGGNPGNEYPWGPAWVDGYANTGESRLSRTTAVGMYPRGACPQGVLDCAGNVWEWCLTDYDRPQTLPGETRPTIVERLSGSRRARADADGGEDVRRVVRGGSWYYTRVSARCAARYNYPPDHRNNTIGFRVVRGSPLP